MHNLVVVFTLSVLDNIHPFGANLVWKIRTVNLSWNLEPKLIRICRIQQTCSLLTFRWETRFFGKLCSKKENCQFKLEFGVSTNWNMQNSMVVFTFWFLDRKHPFWAILVRKIKTVTLSWKLVQRLIPIWKIQMVLFRFSLLDGKHPFWQICFKKSKLSVWAEIWYQDWFEYADFNGGVQIFSFRWETPSFGKLGSKNQNCQFRLKFCT